MPTPSTRSTPSTVSWTRAVLVGGALSLTLVLSACGSDSSSDDVASAGGSQTPTSSASQKSTDSAKARLQFAACMRKNGVDMPDPGASSMKVTAPADPAKFSAAVEKCKQYMPSADGQAPNTDASSQAQQLKVAKCMRGKGLDVQDPSAGAPLNLPDPESTKTQNALKACGGEVSGKTGR